MKAVIDTNGFLGAIPYNGRNKWLFHAFIEEKFVWTFSNEILTEYNEIISKKFSPSTAEFVLNSLINAPNHYRFEPSYKWQLVTNDPDDNKFVDCAIGANVDFLVSDDRHIQDLLKIPDLFPPVPIVSFQQFYEILTP